MLIYKVKSLPDLSLSKYQVFADSGIEGMLEAQTQFIRQLNRVALLGGVSIHFLFFHDAQKGSGKKLTIYLAFSSNNTNKRFEEKLRKIIQATGLADYFQFTECDEIAEAKESFEYMTVLIKKERVLNAVIQGKETPFYVVPNWKMNEEARLYNLLKMMQSFDENCCYRVDLYAGEKLEDDIHKSFERPLSFLRNSSYKEEGFSGHPRQDRRDPNVDELVREYEDWLKAVDDSAVYRCRVCAFSKDQMYGQLLLDSALTEALESGNGQISVLNGQFTIQEQWNEKPDADYYFLKNTPNSMKKWSTSFTVEEISAFTRLPVLYDGEIVELPKETSPVMGEEGMVLGKDKNGYNVRVSSKMLPKHMFVCGVPGSGKTNTMLHIANSLWNHEIIDEDGVRHKQRIPFLVLEPAKKEYRELSLFDIPELVVFSPSACTDFPIRINPFEFAKGLTLSEHINRLCQVFEGAFPIGPPAPFILDKAIQAVYELHGWKTGEINTGAREYPIMEELYEQFEKELEKTNYDGEIRGNIQSVLEMRIGSLLRREMRDIFNAKKSTFSPEEWLTHPVVIELEALGEGPANFVTLLLCTLIREALKVDPYADKKKPVRHVIFIEEAHNLIAPESQVQSGQDSNPKIAATAYIVKMLAEVRALREGIIIADQLPTAMAPEVIKNTNIKMVHRLTSGDDRELVGSTMSASPLQMENMAMYTRGQALFTYEDLLRPFEMQVSRVEAHGEKTPDDAELYRLLMDRKSVFYDVQKKAEEEKWEQLRKKVISLFDDQDMLVDLLKQEDFSKASGEQYSRILDFYLERRAGMEQARNECQNECMLMNDLFISEEQKQGMQLYIQKIGRVLDLHLRKQIDGLKGGQK